MQLARHLTIGETYFSRDTACFDALESRLLDALVGGQLDSHKLLRLDEQRSARK